MLNLVLSLLTERADPAADDDGFLGKLALWGRRRLRDKQALAESQRLDPCDPDDLNLGRAGFPLWALLHAVGAAPVLRRR